MKAWDACRKAIKAVFGSWGESYRSLNLFMEGIVQAMPGTVYKIQSSSSYRFQRGTLLITIGLDANNGLFPLAFGIMESECNESWIWFLTMLHDLLPAVASRTNLCIIFDRHPGLVRGCREIFPSAAHHHCLRHLRENFKKAVRQIGVSDVEFLCQKMYAAGNTDDAKLFNQSILGLLHKTLTLDWKITNNRHCSANWECCGAQASVIMMLGAQTRNHATLHDATVPNLDNVLFVVSPNEICNAEGSQRRGSRVYITEDSGLFSTYSIGGAVLAHLYRELAEATKPKRANIAGCIHLLQIWCWERLHVGRPALHVPHHVNLDKLSVGYRWNQEFIRQLPTGCLSSYRDELDGLLDSQVIWEPYTTEVRSQVADICLSEEAIWLARVPLVRWTRVEWHLPDRVVRQFGLILTTEVQPMELKFARVDGCGKAEHGYTLSMDLL
ncbi:hypothetical protein KFK09_018492 [Dendrobium nobile]|uniref:MULE transposase domain-containing protein n=1 Tax=Dendrobium nobile TaxID=94219 RepID=A0A8T3AVW6_DENNO|nr:hypothetical protein KFK09_018492 [Dendrobium nobile]